MNASVYFVPSSQYLHKNSLIMTSSIHRRLFNDQAISTQRRISTTLQFPGRTKHSKRIAHEKDNEIIETEALTKARWEHSVLVIYTSTRH